MLTDSQRLQRSFAACVNKPYWHWRCGCGFDDNRNTNHTCAQCGEKITCQTAGGHSWPAGAEFCKGGCGKPRSGP